MITDGIKSLLGLARRAGKIVFGADAVRKKLKDNRAYLLIIATDYSEKSKHRVLEGFEKTNTLQAGTMAEWGSFFDRRDVGIFAITDKNFARGIAEKSNDLKAS